MHGHTHEARTEYFSGFPDNRVRMYINTGTYLPLIRRARDGGFAMENQMTMTFFYRADEDTEGKKGNIPSMEMWSGIKKENLHLVSSGIPYRDNGRKDMIFKECRVDRLGILAIVAGGEHYDHRQFRKDCQHLVPSPGTK